MPETGAARMWALNHRLLTNVMNDCAADFGELGLDTKEFFVLAEIEECPYPAQLAARLAMPKATVTVYLKNLEAAGFVRREIDPADLRRHHIVLTQQGRQCITGALRTLSTRFEQRLARLDRHERGDLQRLLTKLTTE
jgi:DNA-binding MarR family transcriptional regulator